MSLTADDIQEYMTAQELDSVVIGIHAKRGYYIALRTSRDRKNLPAHHGRGKTAAEAIADLIAQDEGRAKPTPEDLDLSDAVSASRTPVEQPNETEDDFEDLIG